MAKHLQILKMLLEQYGAVMIDKKCFHEVFLQRTLSLLVIVGTKCDFYVFDFNGMFYNVS